MYAIDMSRKVSVVIHCLIGSVAEIDNGQHRDKMNLPLMASHEAVHPV